MSNFFRISVIVEGLSPSILVRLFFFTQQAFKSGELLLHVFVDFEISSHDLLHLIHVVIDVLVF